MRQPDDPALTRAAELWREGAFWKVHEVLEPAWLAARGDDRLRLHLLILAAAALEAARRGHARGARNNLAKALCKWLALEQRDPRLRAFLREVARALAGAPVPGWPLEQSSRTPKQSGAV